MNRWRRWMICPLLPAILAGCAGSGQTVIRSETQTQAATQLERGIRAQSKGESALAEKFLSDSLKISSSIEDNPARISALVNLARLSRLNSKPESATHYIDQALKLAHDIPGAMAEAAYEKALIELSQKHFAEALSWALPSLSADNGDEKGKRLNLLARIHLASGNRTEATLFASRAREESRSNGQAHEEANSLRILGSMERENRRFIEAGKLLLESLEIDKRIGESGKIALDLEELAALAHDQGDMKMEVDYLERAFSIHISGSRMDKAALNQLKIAEIFRKAGNSAGSDKALKSAEELMRKKPGQSTSSDSASPSSKP